VKDRNGNTFLTNEEVLNVRRDIDKFEVEFFSKIAQHLLRTQDVDGNNLLHNSLIYVGGDMADARNHTADHLPTIIIGKGRGKINTGKGLIDNGSKSLISFQNALLDALGSTDKSKYSNKNNYKSEMNVGHFTS